MNNKKDIDKRYFLLQWVSGTGNIVKTSEAKSSEYTKIINDYPIEKSKHK